MRHETNYREYHETREHAGRWIDRANDQSVFVHVVSEFIVTTKSYQSAESKTVWEENLCHCINPHLQILFWMNISWKKESGIFLKCLQNIFK